MRLLRLFLVAVAACFVAGCGSDDGGQAGGTETTVDGECHEVEAPDPKSDGGEKPPTEELDPAKTYRLIVETNCGKFTIELDQKTAPKTAASLVSLAESGFYDGTTFHRVVPGFVIQGGDPTGTGGGGPGYKTVDVPPSDAAYTKGVVAMAKSGVEAPGTAGSQFFVVTGADTGLPPDYAIVGTVTAGLDVVELIGTQGDPATEQPLKPIVIDSVTASSS
jgi:peptidyl-prolyl cis-trans isomerase B (cyclophilin B)